MLKRIFLILASAILLFACSPQPSEPATEITVEAIDFGYDPASITVAAGQPVTLTLENNGKVEHDFVIEKIEVTDIEASETGPAQHHQMDQPEYDLHFFARAGESEVLQFTPQQPGTYEIFCSIQGHREAGMVGELIVVDQD